MTSIWVQKANITVDKRAQFSSVYLVRYELALSNDYNYKIDKLQLEGTLHHDSFIFFPADRQQTAKNMRR